MRTPVYWTTVIIFALGCILIIAATPSTPTRFAATPTTDMECQQACYAACDSASASASASDCIAWCEGDNSDNSDLYEDMYKDFINQ